MARRKAQNPYGSCLAARGRLPARQSRTFPATGPAFVRSVAQRHAPTDPSASSWQGLLVAPEGAPMPPECLVATRPAGAAPRPASRRLMIAPLSGRGGCIYSEVREAGIMRGQLHTALVIPAQAGIQVSSTELATLDTGFRRHGGLAPKSFAERHKRPCGRGRDRLRPAARRATRAANPARRDRRDRAADPRPLGAA